MPSEDERQPAVATSLNNVVLIYVIDGTLYKRIFTYGSNSWSEVSAVSLGSHPDLVDRSGTLWVVWESGGDIKVAYSYDGGETLTAATTLISNATLPSIVILSTGLVGVACAVS